MYSPATSSVMSSNMARSLNTHPLKQHSPCSKRQKVCRLDCTEHALTMHIFKFPVIFCSLSTCPLPYYRYRDHSLRGMHRKITYRKHQAKNYSPTIQLNHNISLEDTNSRSRPNITALTTKNLTVTRRPTPQCVGLQVVTIH